MQLDTSKKGIDAIFRSWQTPLVRELFRRPLTSREAYNFVVEHDIRATGKGGRGPVSRASVIGFLNRLVDEGLANYTERTAKGGYHKIYKMTGSKQDFLKCIIEKFTSKLNEINQVEETGLVLRLI